MKFINKIYISFLHCDFKLLVFAMGMIILILCQAYVTKPLMETEYENSLVEEVENEKEDKSTSANGLEEAFIADVSDVNVLFFYTAEELFFLHNYFGGSSCHLFEIPIPPPEQV